MRRVKIVATIGPATDTEETLSRIIEAGVDVVRINGAHGEISDIGERIKLIRKVSKTLGKSIGILIDLPGPKMRTGEIDYGSVALTKGDSITIVNEDVIGTKDMISTTVENLYEMMEVNDPIILADGQIRGFVKEIQGKNIIVKITTNGVLKTKKGFFLPNAENKISPYSDTDHKIIDIAIEYDVDFIGLSFVRKGSDVREIRDRLPKRCFTKLISKIETRSAVEELPSILAESDAIMVARGDLGIQLDVARVPLLQKEIIRACNQAGIPVITATEMLESMTVTPVPTRAEVGDVANAVLDGTDAVMLSGETAVGKYPANTVATMSNVAESAEAWRKRRVPDVCVLGEDPVAWAVAHAVVQAAQDLNVTAILCPTRTGATAQRIAAYRPTTQIIGISKHEGVLNRLSLNWGVEPLLLDVKKDHEHEVDQIVALSIKAGYINEGDLVAVASGATGKRAGGTDSIRIVRA
jgi:pyruvate kinase